MSVSVKYLVMPTECCQYRMGPRRITQPTSPVETNLVSQRRRSASADSRATMAEGAVLDWVELALGPIAGDPTGG